ncbi:MAG: bifunctional phosphopantothenoylcysteine decarboxylase/phosphopantothenate--cysteine ligase CoaBC [Canidatus Methanoxibalbensis ujae]|nr:bifunctional phosphopantothenoylcysteine decarboxylase/phosphopantothenate--cysteine ligase CoaBC [Candidatus Methanoxibalbensis ujae]
MESGESRKHPTLRIKGKKRRSLCGKTIVLGVTGSIAAVKTVELARELIRHGADVYAVMSEAAREIIHPYTLEYATGHEVITKLMGKIEHVEFLGMEGFADLFLIAPCTANTLSKIACGISDTTVTAFATTAFGSDIPIMIVPAMHETIYRSPLFQENMMKLREKGVEVIEPKFEEGLAKIASIDDIILRVERKLSQNRLKDKRILVTGGPTMEPIDPIRVLTNRSSGKTGVEIAKEAFIQGADVTLVHSGRIGFDGIKEIYVETADEMIEACIEELRSASESGERYDVFISSAAISDFRVDFHSEKLGSEVEHFLRLTPNRKLIEEVRRLFPEIFMVAFKAETDVTVDELITRARRKMDALSLDVVVANDVAKGGIGTEDNEVFILLKDRDEVTHVKGLKREIAEELVKIISDVL